jgi:hypothetical protein
LGSPHAEQVEMVGPVRASWERRSLVLEWDCLLFGKAIFSSMHGKKQILPYIRIRNIYNGNQ